MAKSLTLKAADCRGDIWRGAKSGLAFSLVATSGWTCGRSSVETVFFEGIPLRCVAISGPLHRETAIGLNRCPRRTAMGFDHLDENRQR